jgi:hypothetical protein
MEVTSKLQAQATFTARKKELLAHRVEGWMGRWAYLDFGRIEIFLDSAGNQAPDRPATSLAAIPTTLYIPECFGN